MSRSALTTMLGVMGIGLLARKHGSRAIPLQKESENPRGKQRVKITVDALFDNPDDHFMHLYDGTTFRPRYTRFYSYLEGGRMGLEGEIVVGPTQTAMVPVAQPADRRELLISTKGNLRNIVSVNLLNLFTPDQNATVAVAAAITDMGSIQMQVDVSWDTRNPGGMLDKILKSIKDSARYRMKDDPRRIYSLNPEFTHTKVSSKALVGRQPAPEWGDLCPERKEWLERTIKEKQPRPRRR